MKYAARDAEFTTKLHDAMKGDWSKRPAFFIERPSGAYSTPHTAPRFNERTGESHAGGCRCEKCCPGSDCQCYACLYVAWMRATALNDLELPAKDRRVLVVLEHGPELGAYAQVRSLTFRQECG